MRRGLWALCVLLGLMLQPPGHAAAPAEIIPVDAAAPAHRLAHFWERMFGSGRAALSLRESYQEDLRAVRAVTGMRYVRFHAILHDELGVYAEDSLGQPVYNFSYVDQVYDGLLNAGVRPFVELSFMPRQLALHPQQHSFWYHPIISPPKDYERWDELIAALVRHLVERYGIEEVAQWYFEVWNEPNLDFWTGQPEQSSYFDLYEHTARAVKAVDARLRVGGPATAQAQWVAEFLQFCRERGVPVDFVSTHIYGDDPVEGVLGTHEAVPRDRLVCRAAQKAHEQILASAQPALPLIMSEFNATFRMDRQITDAPFMGAWLAETIRRCDGLVQDLSYWTFSDVFEERGVASAPFHGGYGLRALGGISKPALNAFALLHQLGDERLGIDGEGILVTRRSSDRALVLALWNYADPGEAGSPRQVLLKFANLRARTASIQSMDDEHGNVNLAYRNMGSPRYPTRAQVAELNRAGALEAPLIRSLVNGSLTLEIAPHGLTVVVLR